MKIIVLGGLLLVTQLVAAQPANFKQLAHFERLMQSSVHRNSLKIFPQFIRNTDCFWYSFRTDEGEKYYFVNPDRKEHRLLFDNASLLEKISQLTGKAYDISLPGIQNLEFSPDMKSFYFSYDGLTLEYIPEKNSLIKTNRKAGGMEFYSWKKYAPDSSCYVYARNYNLFMRGNPEKGKDTTEVQLTTDGEKYFSYASEDEPGIETGTAAKWFRCGGKLYVVRSDSRKVMDNYLVNALGKRPELITYKDELAGDHAVTQYSIEVIDVHTRAVTTIKTEHWPDQYVSVLYAAKAGDRLYFERIKRTWDEMEICVADTKTGEVKVLIHEISKPYINYHVRAAQFLNDGEEIIFRSERSGMGHFYLFDRNGKLKNAVTTGDWNVGQLTRVDEKQRKIWFQGYGREKDEDPCNAHLYEVSLDGGDLKLLTPGNAHHRLTLSPTGKYVVDTYSRPDLEPRSVVWNAAGKKVVELACPDLRRLYEGGWKRPECFRVKAADGVTDLYGVMWKPFDFDSTRIYPVISSVYPGPHTDYVPKSFVVDYDYNTKLAQLGFVVVAVGHRGGSPLRGKKYLSFGYGNFRDHAILDDKAALEQLGNRFSFIDLSRVGIFGHSGGGFMAASALLVYPEFYKAGVACAGNHDNYMYNKGWVEIHSGVQEIRKKGKDQNGKAEETMEYRVRVATNMELASRLKGHLMLVTGDMDRQVHPAHTLKLANALIQAGKKFELVILPGADHGYSGKDKAYFEKKMWDHFARYLLNDVRSEGWVDMQEYQKQ